VSHSNFFTGFQYFCQMRQWRPMNCVKRPVRVFEGLGVDARGPLAWFMLS
jgi:hypothetical protein